MFQLDADESAGTVSQLFSMFCDLCGRGNAAKDVSSVLSVEEYMGRRSLPVPTVSQVRVDDADAAFDGVCVDGVEESKGERATASFGLAVEAAGGTMSGSFAVCATDEPLLFSELVEMQEAAVLAAAVPEDVQESMWSRLKALQCDSDEEEDEPIPVTYW